MPPVESAGRHRRVLMVAYHFPPLAGSSGIQRTLRFLQHLPAHGWEGVVLSTHPRAYERCSDDLQAEIPAGTRVVRAQAWDSARHFALMGRYPRAWALPDRWCSWQFDAVRKGLALIRELDIDAIWTTYPIATAHRIGGTLQQRTGLPWIADFRDPMAQEGYPADPRTWRAFADIEVSAVEHAHACVFATPGSLRLYRERYPAAKARLELIENGYDEASFTAAPAPATRPAGAPKLLLHSGIVYPSERDPTHLFEALALLRDRGALQVGQACVRFRAAVHDDLLRSLRDRHRLDGIVDIAPAVPYREALAEMLGADGLLLLQAANCNDQVPAKVYEYLRARRPLLALTDAAGDTAQVLSRSGISTVAPLDQPGSIAALLARWLAGDDTGSRANDAAVLAASREGRTAQLAALLDSATLESS